MKVAPVVSVLLAAAGVSAFWRMECRGRVGLARIDPLVSMGTASQHIHAIHGSAGFSENPSYADLVSAECTSCVATEDRSAYWHPAFYFQHDNGSYELVPQVGGMLAYYFLNGAPDDPDANNITAFPENFRMIAGDSTRRNYSVGDVTQPDPGKSLWAALGQTSQVDLAQRAIGFNCLNYPKNQPEGSLYRHYLPDKGYLDANCPDGIRAELMFPSCWNGQQDSPNHKDHVAYPDLVMNGNCPDSHPIRLPGLFYEVIWATSAFAGVPGTFVIGNGDTQGFGYHGDYIMGWSSGGFLQQAVSTCKNPSGMVQDCPLFTLQSEAEQTACEMNVPAPLNEEKVLGVIGDSLPGNVKIQYGPAPATGGNTIPPSTPVAVPTVSYSPGVSGSIGVGGVFKEAATSTEADAAPTPDGANINAVPTPSTTSEEAPPPAPTEAPPTTEPPPAPTPSSDDGASYHVVSTQYVTSGNVVSEIIWEEKIVYVTDYVDEVETVTVSSPPQVKVKKVRDDSHLHRHHGRHGRLFRH